LIPIQAQVRHNKNWGKNTKPNNTI